jgi:hypothetical protein
MLNEANFADIARNPRVDWIYETLYLRRVRKIGLSEMEVIPYQIKEPADKYRKNGQIDHRNFQFVTDFL